MFKRLAWLLMAAFLLQGGLATAAEPLPGIDRHTPPDAYPLNILKILRTTNKAQTNSYVPVVYTFRNNNPFNVIRYLRRPVEAEEGAVYTFVSPEGRGGKVLFVVPRYMVESLGALVERLDVPGLTTSSGTERIYRQLKHRRASETDPGFLTTAASFSTGNGNTFLVDPENNALYYEDAPSGTGTLDAVLTDFLDVPTAMVQLAVKVYEVDAYNDGTIGLDYIAWKNGPGRNLFAVGAYSEYASFGDYATNAVIEPLGTGANGAGSFASGLPRNNLDASGYNYAVNYNVPSAYFDFLQTKGKARILNQAKLAALNTWPASISAGDQILYYPVSSSDPSGIRDSGNIYQANQGRFVGGTTNQFVSGPSDEDVANATLTGLQDVLNDRFEGISLPDSGLLPVETGFSLDIVPVIGEQSTKFTLNLNWSDYNGFEPNGFPVLNSRNLSTVFRIAVGDEIVIGGLTRSASVKSTDKIPFFGSLPIIGYAFGGETNQNKKTEIIVAIKPESIMDYSIASNLAPTEAEALTMEQAKGVAPLALPDTHVGFDQLLLDPEFGLTETKEAPVAAAE